MADGVGGGNVSDTPGDDIGATACTVHMNDVMATSTHSTNLQHSAHNVVFG